MTGTTDQAARSGWLAMARARLARLNLFARVAQIEYGQQVHTGLLAAHLEQHAAKRIPVPAHHPRPDDRFIDTVPVGADTKDRAHGR